MEQRKILRHFTSDIRTNLCYFDLNFTYLKTAEASEKDTSYLTGNV
jgi:hypothetical protein